MGQIEKNHYLMEAYLFTDYEKTVKELIKHKASTSVTDELHRTPLDIAKAISQ